MYLKIFYKLKKVIKSFFKIMKIFIWGGGFYIDNYFFLYINLRKNVWCDKNLFLFFMM